ncbi:MAG: glutamate formimidoyltransferase [Anaerolineae bacterium]|nr:glutamate formimidoyltransferase [Anaerolineae bacterium]
MSLPLVECVPNFSEGRRPEVIQAITRALAAAAPVRILDVSSDTDHNRTVVTFVGAPEAVEQAAFAAIRTAAQLIDLSVHRGQHPRLGATDVVPFIPIRDVTMDECIQIARRLGARVGKELRIPVYLYESAATRPDRENLENVRRGEYEGLKDAIGSDPDRVPDFGPTELGKAGATIIGARPPLIAFNAYLTTADVEIAKKIAKAIRHSGGGLRFVKALGLLVDGRAQVSMNLTNYEKTPVYRAVELIRREAARYGVGIAFTELVGLVPENALVDAARWYLQLDMFQAEQILERKLQSVPESGAPSQAQSQAILEPPLPEGATMFGPAAAATIASQAASPGAPGLGGFLDALAAGTPAPGGGSVAALSGALGASLAEMVARLTMGRKKYADAEAEMNAVASAAGPLRRRLLDAVDRDVKAYGAVMDAYKLDKSDPARDAAIQAALRGAAEVPLEVMRLAVEALRLARTVADKGNANAASDAAVGAHMALAAVEGAGLNVRTNAHSMTDPDQAARLRDAAENLRREARDLAAEVLSVAETRAGLR